jgi:hypothetical protein
MRRTAILVAVLTLASVSVLADVEPPAAPAAQEPAPQEPATTPPAEKSDAATSADEQKKEIERQAALIEEQKKRIESQQGDIKALQQQLADMEQTLLSMKRRLDELEEQGAPKPSPTDVATQEKAAAAAAAEQPSNPEVPADVVSAGDFPGSIRIPGSDAAVKFGALIRTAFVFTLAPLGSDTSFLTYTIPVGPPEPGEGARTAFTANTSRFNMDFRTPTGIGQIRAFIEGDFTGSGNTFYLRQAYAQFRGLLVGQTWSTFADPEAAPEDIDFEGVNAKNEIRQPQIRYTWRALTKHSYSVAAETPAVSITGGEGVNVVPDLIGRMIWRPKPEAHVQVGVVFRQIRGQQTGVDPVVTKIENAWGMSVSAAWPFRRWNLVDRVVFQVNAGVGIARYIKDLNVATGEDAVFDTANGTLVALPVLGWYFGYQHMWRAWETTRKMNLRSSIIASWVYVDNPAFLSTQDPSAYERTQRYAGNLVFSPSPRIDIGVEYIWGERTNLDGQSGNSDQIQFVCYFRF